MRQGIWENSGFLIARGEGDDIQLSAVLAGQTPILLVTFTV